MNQFFTGCTHFDHWKINTYCNRGFNTLDSMNQTILKNINDKVGHDDILYHLGDFAFSKQKERVIELIKSINCNNLVFCLGNHDYFLKEICYKLGIPLYDIVELKQNKKRIVLCHYPMQSWNGSYHSSWHLHSHVHGEYGIEKDKYRHDVGVDNNNLQILSYDDIQNIMKDKNVTI